MESEGIAPRVLVAEDNHFTLDIVTRTLVREGFEVLTAINGKQALEVIDRAGLPHLALVDIHMPRMDGIAFCKKVHQFSDLPVIMLTADDNEELIVESIDQFAEDYIVKPFKPRELVARIRRVLRRIGDFGYTLEPVVKVNSYLQVDFPHRKVIVGGEKKKMTPTETKILYILMRNAGRVVTSDFLLGRVWPLEEAFDNRLRVHIHNLRKKIEIDATEPQYILAERGSGYRFPERTQVADI